VSRCDCGVIGPPEDHDSHCSWHPSNVLRDEIDDLTAERDQLQARVDLLAAALRRIQGSAGVPDAAEACRIIIKLADEALRAAGLEEGGD